MHLWWEPTQPATTTDHVEATLEIIEPPTVDRLYFWALQATFVDRHGRALAGAHLGLQWYGAHPGSTAVNWGGYRQGGGELDGTMSPLPSATGNPNTRDFRWRPHTPYRLRIDVDGTGSITDTTSADTTIVRRLHIGGDAVGLASPVVWSEVFAACDDPSAAVRWSDLDPAPRATRLTYQSFEDGGCTNTDNGFVQRTNTRRITPAGPLP
jgi:hypothetical protein